MRNWEGLHLKLKNHRSKSKMTTIMGSLYTAILLLTTPTQILNIHQASGCNRVVLVQDSIVIAVSNNHLRVNEDTPIASIQLKANKQFSTKNKQYHLLMDGIELKQPPEGVYEIYITPPNINTANLESESPYFVDVLDTYTLGSTETKNRTSIDVTNQLLHLKEKNNLLVDYLIIVLFRGNRKLDNSSARNAGALIIESIHLLQTNKT